MSPLLVVWLTLAMLSWCPPDPAFGGTGTARYGQEVQRYAQIAWAALDVAFDPAEKPLFDGPHGRAKTALQLLAIASYESTFRVDVQMGDKRGKGGDACLMQIVIVKQRRMKLKTACAAGPAFGGTGSPAKGGTPCGGASGEEYNGVGPRSAWRENLYEWVPASAGIEGGLSADDLVGPDPRMCFRAGLHMVRESFEICHDLSMYTNGKCNHEEKAKHREMRAKQRYKMHPVPADVPADAGIEQVFIPTNRESRAKAFDAVAQEWGF